MSGYIGTDHISFTVADIERSLVFYRDILGLPVIADQKPGHAHHSRLTGFAGAQLRTVFLALPGVSTKLGLVQYIEPRGEPQELATHKIGDAHICLEVTDIHRVYEEWRDKGAHFNSEPIRSGTGLNKGSFTVYLTDPDGITVQLLQRPRREDG